MCGAALAVSDRKGSLGLARAGGMVLDSVESGRSAMPGAEEGLVGCSKLVATRDPSVSPALITLGWRLAGSPWPGGELEEEARGV